MPGNRKLDVSSMKGFVYFLNKNIWMHSYSIWTLLIMHMHLACYTTHFSAIWYDIWYSMFSFSAKLRPTSTFACIGTPLKPNVKWCHWLLAWAFVSIDMSVRRLHLITKTAIKSRRKQRTFSSNARDNHSYHRKVWSEKMLACQEDLKVNRNGSTSILFD